MNPAVQSGVSGETVSGGVSAEFPETPSCCSKEHFSGPRSPGYGSDEAGVPRRGSQILSATRVWCAVRCGPADCPAAVRSLLLHDSFRQSLCTENSTETIRQAGFVSAHVEFGISLRPDHLHFGKAKAGRVIGFRVDARRHVFTCSRVAGYGGSTSAGRKRRGTPASHAARRASMRQGPATPPGRIADMRSYAVARASAASVQHPRSPRARASRTSGP